MSFFKLKAQGAKRASLKYNLNYLSNNFKCSGISSI